MFHIGWSEILVIAVVAIVVVGPKELPRMLRSFGKTMGTIRRTANDFKRQFDEALREAERDSGLEETRKSLKSIGDPMADIKKSLNGPAVARPAAAPVPAVAAPKLMEADPAAAENGAEPLRHDGDPRHRPAAAQVESEPARHGAEPLKGGAAHPERGSDAA